MGWLNRLPGGGLVIDLLGHLPTDAEMRGVSIRSIRFRSPGGLSPALDTDAIATVGQPRDLHSRNDGYDRFSLRGFPR
ncbi:MAG: hypothetical protein ACKV2Q_29050 [Planctomycetaceae bacterium]